MSEETKSISERIPFVMLSLAVLVRGLMFIAIDGPLLLLIMSGQRFINLSNLLANGFMETWEKLLLSQSAITSFFFAFLIILLVGFATTPLQQALAVVSYPVYLLIKSIFPKIEFFKEADFYSPLVYPKKDYIKVMEWLSYKPTAKTQWEWQQFFFHLWWSFVMSFMFFIIFSSILISPKPTFSDLIIPIVFTFISWLSAMYHSYHMGKVHLQAIKRMNTDVEFQKQYESQVAS